MGTFFSADTHFGHGRIIQYCNRLFDGYQSMDAEILRRFNEVLKPGDVLYHLGDVAWSTVNIKRDFLDKLPTREVHLILGNHDNQDTQAYLKMGFRSVSEYKEIRMDIIKGSVGINGSSTKVILCHYPLRSWNGKGHGAIALYGHCHGTLEPGLDRSMDVGVDTHNFYPWSWEDIKMKLQGKPVFSDKLEMYKEDPK